MFLFLGREPAYHGEDDLAEKVVAVDAVVVVQPDDKVELAGRPVLHVKVFVPGRLARLLQHRRPHGWTDRLELPPDAERALGATSKRRHALHRKGKGK